MPNCFLRYYKTQYFIRSLFNSVAFLVIGKLGWLNVYLVEEKHYPENLRLFAIPRLLCKDTRGDDSLDKLPIELLQSYVLKMLAPSFF